MTQIENSVARSMVKKCRLWAASSTGTASSNELMAMHQEFNEFCHQQSNGNLIIRELEVRPTEQHRPEAVRAAFIITEWF